MRKRLSLRAFTVTEVLVVTGIVLALAAIAIPILVRARREASRTEAISNMRQCALALQIYAGDWGELPVEPAASAALAKAPTCDRADTWRTSCASPARSSSPLIGSFGYVRKLAQFKDDATWSGELESSNPCAMLVDIFRAERPISPFNGEIPPDLSGCLKRQECLFPSPLLQIRLDGSLRVLLTRTPANANGSGHFRLFGWPEAFSQS